MRIRSSPGHNANMPNKHMQQPQNDADSPLHEGAQIQNDAHMKDGNNLSKAPVDSPKIANLCTQGAAMSVSIGQRRPSRHWTSEEAIKLIDGVEDMGRGRWSDIHARWFAVEGRRTVADMKNKWLSLLLTARRPAMKRRSNALPEDLLQKVLRLNEGELNTGPACQRSQSPSIPNHPNSLCSMSPE
eukprot:TRINITY_DN358_c0_g1_i6.p1 TRINITY_DN358_c0_g1~~TRINITY_DN358_c0_g1_i6.p1  ORF type:complete len:186 (-),score=16.14 TRINITY_DN358_c0_g1_i6:150-707(-)